MKLHQNIIFDLLPSFLIFTKVNAIYISGLKRLFKGQGDLFDSSSFGRHASPVPASGNGITFPIDTVGPQISRQVINFNGNGKAMGSALGLPGGNTPRTMMGWLKNTGGASSHASGPFMYGSTGWATAFRVNLQCPPDGTQLMLDYWNINEGVNPFLKPVVDNQWYHVAISWDGTKNIVYVDGQFVKEGEPSDPPNTNVNDSAMTLMGGRPDDANFKFIGSVADFAIFDKVLTDVEVRSVYNDPNGLVGIMEDTEAPSSQPFSLPSTIPSITPSMALTPIPSLAPSITVANKGEFYIENTGKPTGYITSSDEITISIPFNTSNREYGTNVFLKDCLTPFNKTNYFQVTITDLASSAPDGFIQFNTTLIMNITALNGTSYWNTFTDGTRGGWAEACVETYLEVEDTLANDKSKLKVDFKNNILNMSVSLTSDFTVDGVSVEREEAVENNADVDYSKFITAYECEADAPYVKDAVKTYNQGNEITVCVTDNSNGIVQIEKFVDLSVSQDDGNSVYNYIKNALWNPDITTPACIDGSTNGARRVCYAKIYALARFFKDEDTTDLTISGSVSVILNERRVRRNLHIAFPMPVNRETDKTLAVSARRTQAKGGENSGDFELTIPLGSTSDSSTTATTAGTLVALVSMAIGAALVL